MSTYRSIICWLAFTAAALVSLLALPGCHGYPEFDNDAQGNFDALWTILDEHYCFFEQKDVDWAAIGRSYRARLVDGITSRELFAVCADMMAELRDGHCNLAAPFDVSYYRKWWTDYPQDFNLRTLQQYYLGFDYQTCCGMLYKIMPGNIGYIYYGSFSNTLGAGNIDYVLNYLAACDALIIDVRNNGGGELTNAERLLCRFIHERRVVGYITHKTGPGHNDFSKPFALEYGPAEAGRATWDKPVAVLTNRSCFSAANNFVAMMKSLPGVIVVGARTGGGGGMPFSSELPCGWSVRFSASPVMDADGKSIEEGVDPTPGCEVHSPDSELAAGRDAILEFALARLARS